MRKYRKFSAEFKAEQVLALLAGSKTAAEICREHDLKPPVLSSWKAEFLAKAPSVFQSAEQRSTEEVRIAELERLVGRLTMQLEIAKKASLLLRHDLPSNGR